MSSSQSGRYSHGLFFVGVVDGFGLGAFVFGDAVGDEGGEFF